MSFERLVALVVRDEAAYQAYREGMTPLLAAIGGDFGYDFRVSEVLKASEPGAYNRVFTIRFPDQACHDAFFADPAYQAVREKYFAGAVAKVTAIAAYESA